jgi:periplasmic protein TonB
MYKCFLLMILFCTGTKLVGQEIPPPPPATEENTSKQYLDTAKSMVELSPSFKGNWREFLEANLIYPARAFNKGVQGTVVIDFIVEVDGTVTNLEVAPSSPQKNKFLVREAIRVLYLTTRNWIPGYQNGKKVRTYHEQSITFVLPPNNLK